MQPSKAVDEFLALSYWKERKQPASSVVATQSVRGSRAVINVLELCAPGRPLVHRRFRYGSANPLLLRCARDTMELLFWLVGTEGASRILKVGRFDEEISIEGLAQIVKNELRANRRSPISPTIRRMSLALRTCSAACLRSRSSKSLRFPPDDSANGDC